MAEQVVKVLGFWASPYSHRVELALKLKGIPYEFVEEDLSNKSALLLTSNPVHKKIPVLFHNHKPIAESSVILEYIDETWKSTDSNYPDLLPRDPYARATARFWAKTIDDKVIPALQQALGMKKGKEQEETVGEITRLVKMVEEELKGKEFFGGESVGYLDVVGTMIAFWFPAVQQVTGLEILNKDTFPVLFQWIGKLQEVEAVKECCPPKDKLVEMMIAKFSAAAAQSTDQHPS